MRLSSTATAYIRLAKTSLKKCQEVEAYYRNCLRLARHNHQPFEEFKKVLFELRKIRNQHKLQPNLFA